MAGVSFSASKKFTRENVHQELGQYLKEKREEAGLSQREVGEALGYNGSQFVSNFERGLCAPPLAKMSILMKLYKIPMTELVNRLVKYQEKLIRSELKKSTAKRRRVG